MTQYSAPVVPLIHWKFPKTKEYQNEGHRAVEDLALNLSKRMGWKVA